MSEQPTFEVAFLGRFQDAYLKYQHAQTHLATLVGLFNELLQDSWWQPEKIDGAPNGTVRINLLREPTSKWSLIIGDLIHNLRGCLDYATCGMIDLADHSANLARIQFPFGRPGLALNADERKRLNGLGSEAIARIEEIRAAHSADLHLVNLLSNQDKHRLLLPVTVRQVPMTMTIDEASNTASIDEDIDGAVEVWIKEIKNGDEMPMPEMLKLGIALIIEDEPRPFPLRDIERVNKSVWDAFMMICMTERGLLTCPSDDTSAIPLRGS